VVALTPEQTVTVSEWKPQSQSTFLLAVLPVSPTLYMKKPILLSVPPDTVPLDRFDSRIQGDQEGKSGEVARWFVNLCQDQ
jgi:hypothetical protein